MLYPLRDEYKDVHHRNYKSYLLLSSHVSRCNSLQGINEDLAPNKNFPFLGPFRHAQSESIKSAKTYLSLAINQFLKHGYQLYSKILFSYIHLLEVFFRLFPGI